jgi:hypothetical protein
LLAPFDGYQGMGFQGSGEGCTETATVDRQGSSCGNGVLIGGADHHGAELAQLLLEKASCPIGGEGAKAVTTDKLGKFLTVVGWRAAHGPHLHQPYRNSSRGDLPGRFGASQASTDHMDRQAWARLMNSCS